MAKHIETSESKEFNLISSDTDFKGEFFSNMDIRINGSFVGSLVTKGKLIVGPTGLVEGNIVCQNADISGTITANIKVHESLTLQSTAKVTGDIEVEKISIDSGAVFSGQCKMVAAENENKTLA